MSGPTTRGSDKFIIRLPDGMRERIKAVADSNNRTMNAEIVAVLERHYPTLPTLKDLLEGTSHTAYTLRQIVEARGAGMDINAYRVARSLLFSLKELEKALETELAGEKAHSDDPDS